MSKLNQLLAFSIRLWSCFCLTEPVSTFSIGTAAFTAPIHLCFAIFSSFLFTVPLLVILFSFGNTPLHDAERSQSRGSQAVLLAYCIFTLACQLTFLGPNNSIAPRLIRLTFNPLFRSRKFFEMPEQLVRYFHVEQQLCISFQLNDNLIKM